MNEEDVRTKDGEEAPAEQKEIANMDEYDFMDLLIESRIIQLG